MKHSTLFLRMVTAVALAGFAVAGLGFTHVIQRAPGDVTASLAQPAAAQHVHGPGDMTGGLAQPAAAQHVHGPGDFTGG